MLAYNTLEGGEKYAKGDKLGGSLQVGGAVFGLGVQMGGAVVSALRGGGSISNDVVVGVNNAEVLSKDGIVILRQNPSAPGGYSKAVALPGRADNVIVNYSNSGGTAPATVGTVSRIPNGSVGSAPRAMGVPGSSSMVALPTTGANSTVVDAAASGTSTVFRVQGGVMPNASKTLITLDASGNPIIRDATLNISIGDASHAQYFQSLRPGSTVTSFEIPTWMDDFIQAPLAGQNPPLLAGSKSPTS